MGSIGGRTRCSCSWHKSSSPSPSPSPRRCDMNTLERAIPAHRETASLELRNHGDSRLVAVLGERAVPVKLRQCFPWTEPTRHISLRDSEDKEVALVEDPASLDDESRQALELALAEAGFVLEVTRVLDIDEEIEIRQW